MAPSLPMAKGLGVHRAQWRLDWGGPHVPQTLHQPLPHCGLHKTASMKATCLPCRHIVNQGSPLTPLHVRLLPLMSLSGALALPPSLSCLTKRHHATVLALRTGPCFVLYTQCYRATASVITIELDNDLLKSIHHPA